MPVKILRIENFKSIKQLILECQRVNIFIGEPNTGKSNILETIGMLSYAFHSGNIKNFVRFENMIDLFYDHLLYDPITINFDEKTLKVEFKNGKFTVNYVQSPQQTSLAFISDYNNVTDRYITSDLSMFKFYRFVNQLQFPNQKSEFLQPPNGDNILAIIMTNKRIKSIAREIFGKFGYRINLRPEEGKMEVAKELEDVLVSFPYSLASETLQRLVFYLAAINSNRDSIITFEEPEAHAFPYYTKYLAERVALDNNGNQYFIATHNPYFLTSILEKTPKTEVSIFITSLVNYQTVAKPLTEKKKEEILEMGSDVFFNIGKFLN